MDHVICRYVVVEHARYNMFDLMISHESVKVTYVSPVLHMLAVIFNLYTYVADDIRGQQKEQNRVLIDGNGASDFGKATDVHGVGVGWGLGTVRSLGDDDVCSFGGMESIKEEVLIPVSAWSLIRQTCNLAIVPSHPTTSPVRNTHA